MSNENKHNHEADDTRTASCACGGLKLTVSGKPAGVYACSCFECQRATGSAFAYRARFSNDSIVAVEGDSRTWRRGSDAGRWVEQTFCPTCGTLVFMTGEGLSNAIVVSVGCFNDPQFERPAALHRTARRHGWYEVEEGIRLIE